MKLRVAVFAAAALAVVGGAARAQSARGPAAQSDRLLQVFLRDITLSLTQQGKIDAVRTRYAKQFPPANALPDSATRTMTRDLAIQKNEEVRALLTPAQQRIWDRNVADVRALVGSGMAQPPSAALATSATYGGVMPALLKDINMSTEQRVKIDSIRKAYLSKMPAVAPGTRPDSATAWRMIELIRRQLGEIRTTLTGDQQKIWDRNVAQERAARTPPTP